MDQLRQIEQEILNLVSFKLIRTTHYDWIQYIFQCINNQETDLTSEENISAQRLCHQVSFSMLECDE